MLPILLSAFVLGCIVAVMEFDNFPGWGRLIGCGALTVISTAIAKGILLELLDDQRVFILAVAVGSFTAACALSGFCKMTAKRAAMAGGIYFAIQGTLTTILYLIVG